MEFSAVQTSGLKSRRWPPIARSPFRGCGWKRRGMSLKAELRHGTTMRQTQRQELSISKWRKLKSLPIGRWLRRVARPRTRLLWQILACANLAFAKAVRSGGTGLRGVNLSKIKERNSFARLD